MRKMYILGSLDNASNIKKWADRLAEAFGHRVEYISCDVDRDTLTKTMEEEDASLLLIELSDMGKIQYYLDLCREIRIPYLFIPTKSPCTLSKIAVPITFLIEDKEKIPFASAFGRFMQSEIIVYQPKDYGDKAKETIRQAEILFQSFSLNYSVHQGRKDSFSIEREAVGEAIKENIGMVIISASREYGLDDMIFGSKEKRMLKKTQVPIMLINPRGDLYTLCD